MNPFVEFEYCSIDICNLRKRHCDGERKRHSCNRMIDCHAYNRWQLLQLQNVIQIWLGVSVPRIDGTSRDLIYWRGGLIIFRNSWS